MSVNDLTELMRLRKWNQADFARELGMSEAAVSRWLSGERQPTRGLVILLRQWLTEARTGKPAKQPA